MKKNKIFSLQLDHPEFDENEISHQLKAKRINELEANFLRQALEEYEKDNDILKEIQRVRSCLNAVREGNKSSESHEWEMEMEMEHILWRYLTNDITSKPIRALVENELNIFINPTLYKKFQEMKNNSLVRIVNYLESTFKEQSKEEIAEIVERIHAKAVKILAEKEKKWYNRLLRKIRKC